jgi:hypothetical protein
MKRAWWAGTPAEHSLAPRVMRALRHQCNHHDPAPTSICRVVVVAVVIAASLALNRSTTVEVTVVGHDNDVDLRVE